MKTIFLITFFSHFGGSNFGKSMSTAVNSFSDMPTCLAVGREFQKLYNEHFPKSFLSLNIKHSSVKCVVIEKGKIISEKSIEGNITSEKIFK